MSFFGSDADILAVLVSMPQPASDAAEPFPGEPAYAADTIVIGSVHAYVASNVCSTSAVLMPLKPAFVIRAEARPA